MSVPRIAPAALCVDAHAHVYDLQRYPFHDTRGFDAQPNEVGTADQFACVLAAHGLLANPLGGYGTDNPARLFGFKPAERT